MVSLNTYVHSAALIFSFNNATYDILPSMKNTTQYYFTNETMSDSEAIPIAGNNFNNYFAKCCPPGYNYEIYDRKCVQTNINLSIYEELQLKPVVIKHSLSDCVVLVDKFIKNISVIPNSVNALILDDEVIANGKYCLDKIHNSTDYIARICYEKEYCLEGNDNGKKHWCLKKCCPDGYVFSDGDCHIHTQLGLNVLENPDIFQKTDNYAIFNHNVDCVRYLGDKSQYNYTITGYGSLILEEADASNEYSVNEFTYCVDYELTDGNATQIVLLCARSNENDIKFTLSKPALLLSSACLLLTGTIYIFAHKLKKTIHKITLCYCIFQIIAFILLVTTQFELHLNEHCKRIGYVFYYAFLATFSWLNVMCYDIWRNIGRVTTKGLQTKLAAAKKMLFYTCYALTIPLLFTILFYMASERIYYVPDSIYPHIGNTGCLIEGRLGGNNYGRIVYFVLPTGILIFINLVFFVKTIWYFIEVKRNLKKFNTNDGNKGNKRMKINRKKFILILKLTLLMGINWFFEIVSSLIDFRDNNITKYIELIFDTFNCLQGVFIFLILVVKWQYIKRKIVQFLNVNEGIAESTSTSTKSISGNTSIELTQN